MRHVAFVRAVVPAVLAVVVFACGGDDPVEPVPEFTLTVTVDGDGSGRVTSTPAGIDCSRDGGACSASVSEGTSVTLTASADPGSELSGWTGACASDPCVVTVAGPRSVTATFDDPLLVVATIGAGGGEITSADGALTLVIPPGALSGDEEITVDVVDPAELGGVWDELLAADEVEAAYELGPDGTTFELPVRVMLPSEQAAPGEDGVMEVAGDFLLTTDEGVVVGLDEVTVEVDVDEGTGLVSGEMSHFSRLVKTRKVGDTPVRLELHVPGSVQVDRGFEPLPRMTFGPDWEWESGYDVTWVDESVLPVRLAQLVGLNPLYGCQAVGPGEFRAGVLIGAGSIAGSSIPPFRLTVAKRVDCKEAFRTISVEKGDTDGAGTVTSTPEGILCHLTSNGGTGTCSAAFPAAASLTLTAVPDDGSGFAGWTWGPRQESGTVLTFVPEDQFDDPVYVTATFRLPPLIDVSVLIDGDATGTVRDEANGVTCEKTESSESASCDLELPEGTQLSLAPEAGSNAEFAGWSGCDDVVDDVCQVEVVPDMPPVTAVFNQTSVEYQLEITKTGSGRVRAVDYMQADPDDEGSPFTVLFDCWEKCTTASTPFTENTNLVLEATADPDWIFSGWTGDCSGNAARTVLSTLGALTCHATFVVDDVAEPALGIFRFESAGLSAGTELAPGSMIELPLLDGSQGNLGTLTVTMGSAGEYLVPITEALQTTGGSLAFLWPTLMRFKTAQIDVFAVGGIGGSCSLIYEAFGPQKQALGRIKIESAEEAFSLPSLDLPEGTIGVDVFFEGSACTSEANVALGGGLLTNDY